jgi:hypothetical protein
MQAIEQIIGKIPAPTTHWKCHISTAKEGGGEKWAVCQAQSAEDADAKVSTFPLATLSLEAIREAWGPGAYKLIYYGDNGKGGLLRISNSRTFELTAARGAQTSTGVAPSAAPPPAPPPTPANEALTMIQVASMLAKDQIAMIQMLSAQANQQQAAMAAQQVAFLQEHARISHQQMSQHYGAMLRAAKTNEAPILAAVQELGRRVGELEEYEEEPEPQQANAGPQPPLAGVITPDGAISLPHALKAGLDHLPQALNIADKFLDDRAASRAANGQHRQ